MKALPESSAELGGWLDRQLKKLDDKSTIRFTLRCIGGAKASVVERWNATKSSDTNELAVEINQAAKTDTYRFGGGTKKYELIAVVDGENVGRHGFRIVEDGDQDGDDGAYARGTLNDAGVALVKQSQDHVNGLVRALVTLVVGTDKSRLAELDRLASRNETIEGKLDKMRELIEQAQEKQFDREMKRDGFKNQERRLDEAFATGRFVLPFAINAIAKKQLLPTGDNSLLKEALKPVMSEITESQMAELQKIFTPSQIVGLMEVWKLVKDEGKPNGKN